MIDKAVFKAEWRLILDRFGRRAKDAAGRQREVAQARRYYEFLSAQMDTDEFVAAARQVWATARFFPTPVEFLTAQANTRWQEVSSLIASYDWPSWDAVRSGLWWEAWRALGPAKAAATLIGKPDQLKDMLEKQPLKLREAWEKAYEREVAAQAVAQLPPPEELQALPAGGER